MMTHQLILLHQASELQHSCAKYPLLPIFDTGLRQSSLSTYSTWVGAIFRLIAMVNPLRLFGVQIFVSYQLMFSVTREI